MCVGVSVSVWVYAYRMEWLGTLCVCKCVCLSISVCAHVCVCVCVCFSWRECGGMSGCEHECVRRGTSVWLLESGCEECRCVCKSICVNGGIGVRLCAWGRGWLCVCLCKRWHD